MTSVLQEDKDFLLAQRENGRRKRSLAGIDDNLAAKEKRVSEREAKMLARQRQIEQMKQLAVPATELISSGSDSENSSAEDGKKLENETTQVSRLLASLFRHQKEREGEKLSLLHNPQQL